MINVLFQTESHFPVAREKVKEAVKHTLERKIQSDLEVSVAVVGDRAMRTLNKTYRNIDSTTDVLSFPQNDPSQMAKPFVSPPDNILRLGDIIVSYPQAVVEASEDNMLVDDKIVQLVLHGVDHLMGIHHEE